MKNALSQLVNAVMQRDSLEECSLGELQNAAGKYPYFSSLQLLLAAKLQTSNETAFREQAQKLSLYFPDPACPALVPIGKGSARIEKKTMMETVTPPVKKHKDEPAEEVETPLAAETVEINPPVAENEQVATDSPVPDETESGDEEESTVASPDEPETELPVMDTVSAPETIPDHGQENGGESLLNIPALKLASMETSTETISFEPFHTVDYFASQGIRFREEEKPKDKFGQQLKSFTEWLKTLKKVPATEIPGAISHVAEEKVEQLAEFSLADREVITEAMAEVWEKQGNKEKARAIYNKLSLLNPSKSSYFAAKIDHLKQS